MSARPIPLIDLQAQYARLQPQIDARLRAVLDHARFVLGPEVDALETELARLTGVRRAIGVASGTDALLIPLLAHGVGPGDAVFVPAFTFVATAGAVAMTGATPVFCDVDRATFHLDVGDMARRLKQLPSGDLRPKAVIPVDLFGLPCDYAPIRDFAAEHGLLVLADAAQSLGGARDGTPVGGLAPITAASFYPTKPLGGYGDGGAIFTDDVECANQIRTLRAHGQNPAGEFERLGLNSRLDTLQAAVLLAKLATFDADLARRAEIAARYDEVFAEHFGLQARPTGAVSANAVYSILCDDPEALGKALRGRGVGTRVYYDTPLHLMPSMRRFAAVGDPPRVSEWLSQRIISLPIYAELDDEQVEGVCAAVLDAVARK